MKAFFVLACAALAVADPTVLLGYNQQFLPSIYGVNPLINQVVPSTLMTPNTLVTPNMAVLPKAILPKAVTTTSVIGEKAIVSAYNQPQAEKDMAEKAIMEQQLQKIIEQQDALNRGDKAAEVQAYAAQTPMNMQKAAVPKPAKIQFATEPITLQQTHLIAKREAESDPAVLLNYGINPFYSRFHSTLGYPYLNSHIIAKREAESDPAVILRSGLTSYGLGWPYGLRSSVLGYPYANTHIIAKREAEAESDPAVILRSGLSPLSYGLRSSVLGYPYGLRSSVLGYPYVNTHIIAKREAESDPAVILRSGLYPSIAGVRSVGYPFVRSYGYPYLF